jgi:hypothetical protein
VAAARRAQAGDDVQALQSARDALEQAAQPLAALLMDAVARSALQGRKLSEV